MATSAELFKVLYNRTSRNLFSSVTGHCTRVKKQVSTKKHKNYCILATRKKINAAGNPFIAHYVCSAPHNGRTILADFRIYVMVWERKTSGKIYEYMINLKYYTSIYDSWRFKRIIVVGRKTYLASQNKVGMCENAKAAEWYLTVHTLSICVTLIFPNHNTKSCLLR